MGKVKLFSWDWFIQIGLHKVIPQEWKRPFVSLTVGDMYNKTGYLNSLTYNVEDDTTWDTENNFQLPKVVEVDLTFTHIGKYPFFQSWCSL